MRGLLLLVGVLVGVLLGRVSMPPVESAPPVVVERPVAAVPKALPTPVCPPSPQQAEASVSAAEVARAERESLEREASAKATSLQSAQASLLQERDPQRRSELIREIAAHKAQDDLGGAWTWLTQHRADPGYAENVRNLLYQWSYAKPEHVATLLPQVASGEAQAAAAQQLAQLWNKKDPHAYQAWVASLPEGALKTAARSPY
ncbi:MAG: hypothetical protein KF892_00595 [Rhizobacter sp.]|nr:hypothetical protein [Rhizobacter sp.]